MPTDEQIAASTSEGVMKAEELKGLIAFLDGSAAHPETGKWFSEYDDEALAQAPKRRYWWRQFLEPIADTLAAQQAEMEALKALYDAAASTEITLSETITEIADKRDELAEENAALRKANESVAVCQAHVPDITQGSCLVCEIHGMRQEVEALRQEADVSDLTIQLTNSLLSQICETMKGPNPENGLHSFSDLPQLVADMRQEVEALRGFLADIASVAGRDVPDAIDNDGQPYQSQSLSDAIDRATLPTKETGQ